MPEVKDVSVTVLWAAAGLALAGVWVVLGSLLRRAARQVRPLDEVLEENDHVSPRADSGPPVEAAARASGGRASSGPPRLSVIIAACDEADGVERTVRRVLAQRGLPLEVIAVDDRSTDATGGILDRLAAEETSGGSGRLIVVHIRARPQGWLGKCHACHAGAAHARGEWILFMDGDVEIVPDDLLSRVIDLVEGRGYDHVAVLPDSRPMSALQTALVSFFGHIYLLAARAHEIDRDLPRGGAGVGAFNLVRRAAYDRVGGHTLLRMDPADDFKLGRLLKESGARQRLYTGIGLVRCAWHRGALAVVRGLEKNLFAGAGYSLVLQCAGTVGLAGLVLGPALVATAAVAGAPSGGEALTALPAAITMAPAFAGLVVQAAVVWRSFLEQTRRTGGNPTLLTLLYPVAAVLFGVASWNSAVRTLHGGGIRWRGTFYALSALRRGLVPAGAGRRLARGCRWHPRF